jgi:hypothetical protein
MAAIEVSTNAQQTAEQLRLEWLNRLSSLVDTVQGWAKELGWATRRIEKRMEEAPLGKYLAPALLLQEDTVRVILEPVARFVFGAEGAADLYLMPAYDDIANLYLNDTGWQLHYVFPGTSPTATISDANAKPLTKDVLHDVLEEMRRHAAQL